MTPQFSRYSRLGLPGTGFWKYIRLNLAAFLNYCILQWTVAICCQNWTTKFTCIETQTQGKKELTGSLQFWLRSAWFLIAGTGLNQNRGLWGLKGRLRVQHMSSLYEALTSTFSSGGRKGHPNHSPENSERGAAWRRRWWYVLGPLGPIHHLFTAQINTNTSVLQSLVMA